ncbi:MAG: cysteine hydrolase [Deltaproteobacteria bacterium]|jgi:ureidoacrylate peracid hydrolase|nr:cysteine hydrolase [Deltaproteobacteria bacterium]
MDVFSAKNKARPFDVAEPESTAVLVIDMVNDFCKPGGSMVLPGYESLLPPQLKVIDHARRAGCLIVYIVDAHRRGAPCDREFLKRSPHCYQGEWGAQIIDELKPQPEDQIVYKRRFSAFFNTDLDVTLKDWEKDTLIFMGVATNICVRSTVHDAFFYGYHNIVVKDAVAATSEREQASTLYDIATHFGIVTTADSLASHLTDKTSLKILEAQ